MVAEWETYKMILKDYGEYLEEDFLAFSMGNGFPLLSLRKISYLDLT